jgi:hypothetical protein
MTGEDIEHIERALAITLPETYKHALVPFRIPALIGNTEYELWDDAERLVVLNRKLRAGSRFRPAWPRYLFAVGNPHADVLIAVDTREPDGPVWWLDHGLIDHPATYVSHSCFKDWVEEFYRDVRQDLVGDGYDPERAPG